MYTVYTLLLQRSALQLEQFAALGKSEIDTSDIPAGRETGSHNPAYLVNHYLVLPQLFM